MTEADHAYESSTAHLEDWPAPELQAASRCPVCDAGERSAWLDGLRDQVFRVAPGRWSLWRCAGCRAAYLDPRPDPASIGRAYGRYYTHGDVQRHLVVPGDRPGERVKRAVLASYCRWRYGHRLGPTWPLAWLALAAWPLRRARIDHQLRHLPAAGPEGVLLDVGCGDGSFLRIGRALGYTVQGIETDPRAAETARQAGMPVHVGVADNAPLAPGSIDQITMNHVVEHLHDPLATLRHLQAALRPGGRIWIQTPNIDSLGAKHFQQAWRGLEPPRHLVLFHAASLRELLGRAGFRDATLLAPRPDGGFMALQSQALADGRDPYGMPSPPVRLAADRLDAGWARAVRHDWERAESITMVAWRDRAA